MISLSKIGVARMRLPASIHTSITKYSLSSCNRKQAPSQKQILIQLRKDTGYPLAKCKQALIKANYDVETALDELHRNAEKENWDKMENLSVRKTSQGLVTAYRVDNHAVLLEINCETDFVAKTPDFQNFVGLVARSALSNFTSIKGNQLNLIKDDILRLPVPGREFTVQDALVKVIGKVKENVNIPRGVITSVDPESNEFIGIYTHPDLGTPNPGGRLPLMGRYAAAVGMKSTAAEPQGSGWLLGKARDLAQHVVGMCPVKIGTRGTVQMPETSPATSTDAISQDGDEDEVDETIMFSQMVNYHSDELLNQAFLLDANITVQNWLDINRLDVNYFHRYELGGDHKDGNS